MSTGSTRQILTYLFVIISIAAAIVSLVLSNRLSKELSDDEQKRLEIWAMATENLVVKGEQADLDPNPENLQSNSTFRPSCLMKHGEVQSHNIALPKENEHNFH